MKRRGAKKHKKGPSSEAPIRSVFHGDAKVSKTKASTSGSGSPSASKQKTGSKGVGKPWVALIRVGVTIAIIALGVFLYDQMNTIEPTPVWRNTTEWKAVKASTQKRLLLACHRNLVWYDVDGDRYSILNDAHLIYYGMVPADAASKAVWVVSSKLETRKMKDKKDQLLRIDSHSGEVLEIKPLPSMFTHDAVQSSDGSKLYVADTSKGHILVYSFPDVTKIKALPGFKREHHINTLSPTSHGTIWVLLLNRKGKSFMVEIDANTGERLCIVKDLGEDCHGLVQLDDGVSFLMLSSSEAALMKVRIPRFCKKGDVLTADRTVLWQYKQSLVQKTVSPKFLKGLAVLDDVAYFGMSEYEGTREGRIALSCALLAFDLRLGKLLWIREKVGTRGLINVIGAPHLAQGSVYKQQWTDKGKAAIQASASKSECEKSYLQALTDSKHYGPAFGMPGPGIFFIELPLRFDLPRLRKETRALEKEFGWTYRADVNNYFILLVTRLGERTDQSNHGPFYPVPGRLERSPYLRKVMDSFQSVVGRSRFMQLKAGKELTRHFDRTEHVMNGRANPAVGYWGRRFRVHIPVISDQTVVFRADDAKGSAKIHMKEGHAYLFDNSVFHSVYNPSKIDRVHLIFDTIGSVELFRMIQQSRVVVADSVFTRFPDTNADEVIQPIEVKPAKDDADIELVYENWTDAPVFRPMHPDKVATFLNDNVLEMVLDRSKSSVQPVFDQFIRDWKQSCFMPWYAVMERAFKAKTGMSDAIRESELSCKDLAGDLLKSVLKVDICGAKPASLRFKSSMSLSTVVESFTRMLFYECTGMDRYNRYYLQGPPCQIHRNPLMDEIRGAFL